MQEIDHILTAGHLLLECRGTRLRDSLQAIQTDHGEDLNELPIAITVLGQPLSQARQGSR